MKKANKQIATEMNEGRKDFKDLICFVEISVFIIYTCKTKSCYINSTQFNRIKNDT